MGARPSTDDGEGGMSGSGNPPGTDLVKTKSLGIRTGKSMRGSMSTPHLDTMSAFGQAQQQGPFWSSENPQGAVGGLDTFEEEDEEDFYDDFDAAEEGGLAF
eukprot:g1352.t1